ncbi:hypothetical protein AB0A73_13145 [Glycomyces sp. NPDC047369]
MIPAKGNYKAAYRQNRRGKDAWDYKRVEAWDDEGRALVLSEQRGRLVRADSWSGFDGITEDESPIVAVLPGGGWLVEWTNDEDGTTSTEPLLAWAVNSAGWATPIDAATDGIAMPLEDDSKGWRLIPPSGRTEVTQ